jgi:hypothetical protein
MKPTKDFQSRYDDARQFRDQVRPEIEDTYRFCAPSRRNEFTSSYNARIPKKPADTLVYHSLGETSAADLAGDIVTYFTPSEAHWFEISVLTPVPEEMQNQVLDFATRREQDIRDLIAASNYNDIAPQWAFEAASQGTPALWVQLAHQTQPIFCESVPPSELLITPGHLGYLDRFRQQTVRASTLPALFAPYPQINLETLEIRRKIEKPGAVCTCVWGFWLDWADAGNPQWRMEVTVDGKRVTPEEPIVLGPMSGACPLLVGRFNPQPGQPWGRGPGMKGLPDLRVLDKVEESILLGLEDQLKTTLIYSSDAYLDLSKGIRPGTAYPAGPRFTKDQVYELNKQTNLENSYFTREGMSQRILEIFYQTGPRQRGDTPPTATQWLDEARRVQERLGKPSAPLWSELIFPFVQRVEWIGVQAGLLENVMMIDGQAITLKPISPLQKSQNRDDVLTTRANLQLAFEILQDQVPTYVDITQTLRNVIQASGDRLIVINKEPLQNEPAPVPAG